MKKKYLLILCSAPFIALAQQPSNGPDTVITKDADNPNAEYWIIHSKDGKISADGKMLNQKKEGLWREYNNGGSDFPSKAEEYHAGERDGASISFGTGGNVTSDETYRNGKKEGPQMTYNSSWKLQSIEYYHNGLLEGRKIIYYDDSKIKEEGNWKNGQRDGKISWYFSNGKPSIEYTYKDGVLNGPATTYSEKGTIISKGDYLNNDENGKWDMYDEEGNLEKTVMYDKGKVVKEIPAKKTPAVKK